MILAQVVAYRLQIIYCRWSPPKPDSQKIGSTLEHPLNAGVHLLFLDEFAARDLLETHLHLLFEPLVVGKQPGYRFLHQIVGVSSRRYSKLV